jgi:1,4-alpha-glucan branching enzyme
MRLTSMGVIGHVALVLHAHLPYVRHPEYERPLEERWLHEALWESYLPLVDMLDRLEREDVAAALTISVSPPLAAMLTDELLRGRFADHLSRLERLAAHLARGEGIDPMALTHAGCVGPALPFYIRRLAEVRAAWERTGGDVLGALVGHHDRGRIELITTTATHAYLPGLLAAPASIRAQVRLGLRSFAKLTSVRPLGLWLPECAFDPRFESDLAAAGVRYTVLDAHGLELARPRPPFGIAAPVLGRSGVAFFARDPDSARDVWSREVGYPGDPVYREFYRDAGFDLPEDALLGELGPYGTRVSTGLKLHRITGRDTDKEPYDPEPAAARARAHAQHFVAEREKLLCGISAPHPILVAPFDAELFGHWWFEGPIFLEEVLRALDASARAGGLAATTLGGYLTRFPEVAIAEPAASTWGEGGFGAVWAGPEAARLWRHVHHAEQRVRSALGTRRGAGGLSGRALEQAIRELLLLESSDWAFMLRQREMTGYAEERVKVHAYRAGRLSGVSVGAQPTVDDLAWVHAVCHQDRFLGELSGEEIRDAFDPWDGGAFS